MVLIKITAGINRHHIIADHQSRAGLCQQLTGKVVSTVCKRSRFFYTVMVNRKIVFCKKIHICLQSFFGSTEMRSITDITDLCMSAGEQIVHSLFDGICIGYTDDIKRTSL